MRRLVLAVALLLLGAPQAEARCTAGRDVAADLGSRVYTVKDRWYACARTAAKPIRIAGARRGALARVSYPYAAVTVGTDKVRLYDLRDRTKAGMRTPGEVTDLVLARDGVATVIAAGQVLRMNLAGAVTTVDPGPAARRSLAISKNAAHVYWMERGAPQTAGFAATPYADIPARRGRYCGRSRVWPLAADSGGWLLYANQDEFVGCLSTGAKPITFLSNGSSALETVAAPFVAMVQQQPSPYGSGTNDIHIYDLRGMEDEGDFTNHYADSFVSQLELTNRGVAYFVEAGAVNFDGQIVGPPELFRLDQRGRVTALDTGAITEGSLTLTPDGRRVYWTKDGAARTR